MSSKYIYDFNYFIQNYILKNCEIIEDKPLLTINTHEKSRIIIKSLTLEIGIYILDFTITSHNNNQIDNQIDNQDNNQDNNQIDSIGKILFNNNEFTINNGKNNIDLYITDFNNDKNLIIIFNKSGEYNISDFQISANVNDVLFEPCDTQYFDNTEHNNEKIKTEINIENNNIYPTESISKHVIINNTKNKNNNIIITKQVHPEQSIQKEQNNLEQVNLQKTESIQIINKKVKTTRIITKNRQPRIIKNNTLSNIAIDKIYILNEQQLNYNINSLYSYYNNHNINCEIINIIPYHNENIKNKENAIKIKQIISILNNAIKNKYKYILILTKNVIPNINNNLFISNNIISSTCNNDITILSQTNDIIDACVIRNTIFNKLIQTISNYKFSFELYIKDIIDSKNYKTNIINNYFYNINDTINLINYIYILNEDSNIEFTQKTFETLDKQKNTKYYLTIYYNDKVNIKQFESIIPKNPYINLIKQEYTTNYDIIKQIDKNQYKYICILPNDFIFDNNLINKFNLSIKDNDYDFINCGYTINNTITNGQLYTKETFIYVDLIRLCIIKSAIINYCLSDNIFNFYKNILNNDTNKTIIYDSFATLITNDLQYETINEQNQQLDIETEHINETTTIEEETINNNTFTLDLFDMSKDTILCYYSKNSINNQRLYNMVNRFTKYYNIIIISDTNKYEDNITFIKKVDINNCIEIIKVNKILAIFNDISLINEIKNININDIIFDIIDLDNLNKLHEYIKDISFISYANINYLDKIKEYINNNSNYYLKHNKTIPQILYIPNCINNYTITNNIKPETLRKKANIINVSYIGAINQMIDFNIIKNIANYATKLNISLNMINTLKLSDENKLMFKNDNIQWLDISDSTDIDNEIQKYILYSDIIIFPFNKQDNYKYITPKEFNIALYYKKPVISSFDYLIIEKYVNKQDSLVIETTQWIEQIQKTIQELNCNIIYDYKLFNDKLWDTYIEQLYKTIQTNENLFLSSVSDKLIKSCAIITQMFNNDEQIFGFKQYMILNMVEILLNNGINPTIFQISNIKKHAKIKFNDNYYKVHFIVNDDLYTLNNYDCTMYDSLAFDFIKNINPNSIYLNFNFNKNNIQECNKFIKSTILTLSNNQLFNSIYSFIGEAQNEYKLYYIPSYYVNDSIEADRENNKLALNLKINVEDNSDSNLPVLNNDTIINHNINILYYEITNQDLITIQNIITQIRNKNILFKIRITIKPNKGLIEQLNNLCNIDNRVSFIILNSYEQLINFYSDNSITIFNNNQDLYLEYYNAIVNNSIVITYNNISSQIIHNFNGIILDSTNINVLIKTVINIIDNYKTYLLQLQQGIEYTKLYYSFSNWKDKINNILYNIAWIYKQSDIVIKNNHLISINKEYIAQHYITLWKNYAHTLNIQNYYKSLEVETAIKNHLNVNQNCNIKVANNNKKVMILLETNKYSDISYIINNISQYLDVDIYIYSNVYKEVKYNDFIYDYITINQIKEKSNKYDLLLYFNLSEELLKLIHSLTILSIQYINDINDINSKYISYSFPTKIITHSPYIANYLSYKYNIIPTILPYPIKYMIDPNNIENKEHKIKKNISCFTYLNKNDGVEIFIKMLKRYQTEYGLLNENYNLIIYYYPYNNDYLKELQDKVKILDIYIDFIEIKKNIDYYILNSDLIIIPILHNCIPSILLRGLLYNKNIMISSQYSIRELNTIMNINGYSKLITIFRQNDVANLKTCFNKWINEPFDENKQESEYILKYYNSEIFINKLIDIIDMI